MEGALKCMCHSCEERMPWIYFVQGCVLYFKGSLNDFMRLRIVRGGPFWFTLQFWINLWNMLWNSDPLSWPFWGLGAASEPCVFHCCHDNSRFGLPTCWFQTILLQDLMARVCRCNAFVVHVGVFSENVPIGLTSFDSAVCISLPC